MQSGVRPPPGAAGRRRPDVITVIIPTLRRPLLLARAIRSVQAQTVEDLTIAVTDNGPEILTKLA